MNKFVAPEQLTQLKEHQERLKSLLLYYGELNYQKRQLETELVAVEQAFDELEEARIAISQQLQEQFGSTGSVNLATGEFVSE